MNEVNEYIYCTLKDASGFSEVMGARCFALFAPEKTDWPFCVYSIPGGVSVATKDARQFSVAVSLFFNSNQFTECCDFTDKVMGIMGDADFEFQSINVDYDDEYNAVVSTLIYTIIQK